MKSINTYSLAWIVTGLAVLTALFLTKNADCLWGLFIPVCMYFKED